MCEVKGTVKGYVHIFHVKHLAAANVNSFQRYCPFIVKFPLCTSVLLQQLNGGNAVHGRKFGR